MVSSAVAVLDTSCIDGNFLSERPPQTEIEQFYRGERDFSVNLIKSLFQDFNATGIHKNIFVSPSSIYATLMLAYFGSAGQTQNDLATVMGTQAMTKQAVQRTYLFERAFQDLRQSNPDLGYKLTHANKIYFDRALPLNQCIQLLLQNELGAVDFGRSEKTRKEVNQFVLEKTNKKIKDFLPPGAFSASTKMALVNAAYFKGDWASKFDINDTKRDNFYINREKIAITKFMTQKGKFNYYTSEELRAHVLQMPYQGDDLSMIFILPPFEDDSLYTTVQRMTPEIINGVMDEVNSGFYEVDDLTVEIPKFKIEQTLELSSTLGKLGLNFFDSTQSSNFTDFLDANAKAGDPITFSNALHKSYIEVNEEGSEAAGASALFGFRSARPFFHTHFIANHPFLFLIFDEQTKKILFFGVFQDPRML